MHSYEEGDLGKRSGEGVKAERYAMRMYKIELILDRTYGEYRNACYRAKVQVGEPLPKEE